jgi:hypothetical protein
MPLAYETWLSNDCCCEVSVQLEQYRLLLLSTAGIGRAARQIGTVQDVDRQSDTRVALTDRAVCSGGPVIATFHFGLIRAASLCLQKKPYESEPSFNYILK